MKIKLFIFIFLIFYPISIFAQGVSIEAFVDKPTISMDDEVVLTVRIKGASVLTEPQIPSRGNFQIVSRGSSSRIEMVNGNLSALKEYVYILSPQKAGEFAIGPISVFVGGTEYKAGPISVVVAAGGGSTKSAPSSLPPGSPPNQNPLGNPTSANNKDVFVTAEVDQKNPYKGEQVIYTFRLYTSRNIGSASLRLPEIKDFLSEEVQKENKYYKEIDGKRFVVSEYRIALFPTRPGSLTIPPSTLEVQIEEPIGGSNLFNDPFFNFRGGPTALKLKTLKTSEIKLEVKPLPSSAPADFKGLVGSYKLESTLSDKEVAVGETTTLTLTLSGDGNLKDAQIPQSFKIPNLKIYEDKPITNLKKSATGLSGSKSFKFALVPEAPGQMQIPSVGLSYFDPKKGSYEQLRSSPFDLIATPGSGQEKIRKSGSSSNPVGSEVNPLAEDIATIHSDLKGTNEETGSLFIYFVFIFFLIPPFSYLAAFFIFRRREWIGKNSQLVRKQRALSQSIQQLKEIQNHKVKRDIPGEVSYIVKKYLGDKIGKVGTALTPFEVKQIFVNRSSNNSVGESLVQFLQDLEGWQYGGLSKEKGWEERVCDRAIELIKAAEKELG